MPVIDWKKLAILAVKYINQVPCDPDIYQEQVVAWIRYKKELENFKSFEKEFE